MKQVDWAPILRRAAKAGKQAILRNYDSSIGRKVVRRGAGGDLTLGIDEASEEAIYRSLNRDLGRDKFVFVSEEVGEVKTRDDEPRPIVICDPLDGSHNAQVGIPFFSISLAVLGATRKMRPSDKRHFRDVDAAMILSVPSADEFIAIKGRGAFQNGTKLGRRRDTFANRIQTLAIECGDIDYIKEIMTGLSTKKIYKTRILGSAALSFCMLAIGAADAFVFAQPGGARTIDSPGGYLIARETNCIITDLSERQEDVDSVEVGFHSRINLLCASNEKVHSFMLQMVRGK